MKRLILAAMLLSSCAMPALAEVQEFSNTLTVTWDKPTKRLNGLSLTDQELSHYDVKFIFSGNEVDYRVDHPKTELSHVLTVKGNHCATVRAVDSDGLYSPWADQVCIDVTSPPQKLIIRFITGANNE